MGRTTGPKKGEKVYSLSRKHAGEQPNGRILYARWADGEFTIGVRWYTGYKKPLFESSADEFTRDDFHPSNNFRDIWYPEGYEMDLSYGAPRKSEVKPKEGTNAATNERNRDGTPRIITFSGLRRRT